MATTPSLIPAFLGQNRLKLRHLVLEHTGHLVALNFHLCHHLGLQRLDLCRVLAMIFGDGVLKRLVHMNHLLHLLLEDLQTVFCLVSFPCDLGEACPRYFGSCGPPVPEDVS